MVQVFINGIYRSMKWMKATPLPEVQALVAPKHFSGYGNRRAWLRHVDVDL